MSCVAMREVAMGEAAAEAAVEREGVAAAAEVATQVGAVASAPVDAPFVAPEPDDSVPAPRRGGTPYRVAKRAFDVAFSLCACAVLLAPALAACAVIAAETPGSPVFSQERVGRGGKPIRIWKLRTMVPDAHDHPERYMTPEQLEVWRREQKLDDDPRVTRVGRALRRTSLASVIIGTPGDGEPTKSFSHPANSSLDLQLCERRPELASHAEKHYNSTHFLSVGLFRGLLGGEKGLAAGVSERPADASCAECAQPRWAVAA